MNIRGCQTEEKFL